MAEDCLVQLKYPTMFVDLLMACVTSPYYSLQINGGIEGVFPGKRGLRLKAIATCLDEFDLMSGLQANPTKTNLYFGGVKSDIKELILAATGFSAGVFPFRYLGLPLFTARITKDMYQPLLDKIKDKIMHWANRTLSYAGKTLLINSVIFGLNNFWGASVLLHKGIAKKITKLCKDFIWGIDEGHRRHIFMKWQLLCAPKIEGAIGIKEVLSWNCAQMTKWVWKLLFKPQCLWSRWVQTYVLKGRDFWSPTASISQSRYWNNVVRMKDKLLPSFVDAGVLFSSA
ncbi:uncharacterized protein LOC141627837 [Silene latifolia]|uniref:uncharacterized protein LOC141627837 n=1 Tax=Silene latifolia TaxID=37657 RepID=UPI003D787579